jgi:hypothetical protein
MNRSYLKSIVCAPALCTVVATMIAAMAFPGIAQAVPAFARQTGLECTSCHMSWLELAPTGRQFKLNGYTLGQAQTLPLAAMLQLSRTDTKSVKSSSDSVDDSTVSDEFPRDRQIALQQASVFVAGKITEKIGTFTQITYDGVERRTAIDNFDLRFASRIDGAGGGTIYGLTLNNSPSVQDVYNTGPVWGFPYASSSVAIAPNADAAIAGLGQQVAGLGAYAFWRNTVYAEASVYRTADKMFSVLRAGTNKTDDAALKGYNPYWRLAVQREWDGGRQSAMLGTYGMIVDQFPDNTDPQGATDRFRDLAVDGQYQYIGDRHRFSAQFNLIRERQQWNASPQSSSTGRLTTLRAKATYYFDNNYGATLGHFSTRGSEDALRYDTGDPVTGSAAGTPNTRGYIAELNWLPKRDIRIVLQYTGYTRFNGAKTDYDGFGRNARDNNSLYLLAWLMF